MTESSLMGSRLRAQLGKGEGLKELDKVVEKYGRVEGEPFSFDGHEFQREIIRDTRSRIYVKKASQIGMSELMAQKILAMCAVMQHKRIIFTMPVVAMAQKFSKDRISGIIEQSDYYRGLVMKANDSASQKRIGSCVLYIGGTYGDNSAISVPAEVVVHDELDFSDLKVIGKASSRLRHASKDEKGYSGTRIMFSTPTVEDYGIDTFFKKGHQAHYMVKCTHCGSWENPSVLHDIVVPGMDKPNVELEARDVDNPRYKFQESWVRCPSCGGDLWSSICDPSRREWVAKHPDRWEHSYQAGPFCVPMHNTPASIMTQVGDYPRFQDWMNFTVGETHTSAENSFMVSQEHKDRYSDADLWIYGQYVVTSPTVIGVDVGKTCHLTVLAKHGKNVYVVWAEAIKNTIQQPATEAIVNRFDYFNCVKMCVDAGPDITLVNQLVGAKHLGAIAAVQYVRNVPGLDIISEHDDGQLIKADRTAVMNDTMRRHNIGEIHYPAKMVDEIFSQLKSVKKVRSLDVSGGDVERFEASGEDHWAHSLTYANIAAMALDHFATGPDVAMPPMIGKMRVK